jgi:transposase
VHALCLIDQTGRVLGTRTVAHTAAAVEDALAWVETQTRVPPHEIAVAIERPQGVLVDTFLDRGWAVFAINPKQLDRFRDRFTTGGAKDDRRDAYVASDALRTDMRAFHRVWPTDPRVLQLRELCRIHEDLQQQQARLSNRLREQLLRVDAAWLTVSPAADESWLWALLAKLPQPTQWARIGARRLQTALRTHRIRRIVAADLLTALRQPRLRSAPGVAEAVALQVRTLVPQLQLLAVQRTTTQQQIDQALAQLAADGARPDSDTTGEHRDVVILRSLPGVGRMVTATMLTEAAGPLAARDYATLRAHAGAAPVTKRSGKSLWHVHMRYACNPRLRQALYHWARASLSCDRATRIYYDALRARGHRHGRALRSVADRWLRILIAMLRDHSLYDPARSASHAVATV